MRIKKYYFPIIIFTTLAVGVVLGGLLNFPSRISGFSFNSNKNKLDRLIDFVDNEYVDSVNMDSIIDLTVNGILGQLDPHSVYIAKNEAEGIAQSMKGDFVGIGINFYMYKDTLAVIKTVENGSSEKAGIKSGDRILMADKDTLYSLKLPINSIFSKLKGIKDTEVTLTIYRKDENKKFRIKVKRDVVAIKSVDIALMLDQKVGYIKINRFAETTYSEFRNELIKLQRQGLQELVIDVRDNGGGYFDKTVKIIDELLEDKMLIVFTKSKNQSVSKIFATKEGLFEKGNVYVLINENSASASEILAGAIQDNDRGIVVGRRSFGKGLVQREMSLGDGSMVRLTVSRYFTPTGRSIQKPYKKGAKEYFNDFTNRFESGELYAADSIKISDTLQFKTPKGKIVYGGGGIVPDIFVPLEGKHGDEVLSFIMQSGLVGYFVFEQLDKDRKQFLKMSFEQLKFEFEKKDTYYNNFKEYLKTTNLSVPIDHNKGLVKRYLSAEFARQLYGDEYYYRIVLKEDTMIKRVLSLEEK